MNNCKKKENLKNFNIYELYDNEAYDFSNASCIKISNKSELVHKRNNKDIHVIFSTIINGLNKEFSNSSITLIGMDRIFIKHPKNTNWKSIEDKLKRIVSLNIVVNNKKVIVEYKIISIDVNCLLEAGINKDDINFRELAEIMIEDIDDSRYYIQVGSDTYKKSIKKIYNYFRSSKNDEINNLKVLHQPIYDIKTQKVKGFESLVRWQLDNELIGALETIESFEYNNKLLDLDRKVIEESFKFANEIKHLNIYVSINLSEESILSYDCLEFLNKLILKYDLNYNNIQLEVLEELSLDDNIRFILKKLSEKGFRIAIDDFGTGYSNMYVLTEDYIKAIKIDRTLIIDSIKTKKGSIILQSIIHLLKSLSYDIVCEGIEFESSQGFIETIGGCYGQGFLFSKPIDKSDALTLIQEKNING